MMYSFSFSACETRNENQLNQFHSLKDESLAQAKTHFRFLTYVRSLFPFLLLKSLGFFFFKGRDFVKENHNQSVFSKLDLNSIIGARKLQLKQGNY